MFVYFPTPQSDYFIPPLSISPAILPSSHSKSLCKKRQPDSKTPASHSAHSINLPASAPMLCGPGLVALLLSKVSPPSLPQGY